MKNNENYSTMWKCSNFSLEILYLIDFEKFFKFITMWIMECYLFEYQWKYPKSNLIRPRFVLHLLFLMNEVLWYVHNRVFNMENFLNIKSRMDFNFETIDSRRYYFKGLIRDCSSCGNVGELQIFCKSVQTLSPTEHDIGCSILCLFFLLICCFLP